MKNVRITLILVGIFSLGFYSFNTVFQDGDWVVPEAAKKVKNPTDPKDEDNLDIGKTLYDKHCKSCHGKEGLGDGPKAAEIEVDLGDFSSAEFQAQTDGTLFYKTTEGKDDMPSFAKKIASDEDRWLVVNYMRTLAE